MDKFIAVIDYGLGNLRSVSKALEAVGAKTKVTNEPKDIANASALVLPGVGAFYRAMENFSNLGVLSSIFKAIKSGKPFLGICLGLQLLFTESEEHGRHKGFDILKGKVKKIDSQVKIPHMGWNQVKVRKTEDRKQKTESRGQKTDIFKDIPDKSYFYFDHTYYVEPEDKEIIIATTKYGRDFVSAVNKDNIWGLQFHPEKSTALGLKILGNFCRYVSPVRNPSDYE